MLIGDFFRKLAYRLSHHAHYVGVSDRRLIRPSHAIEAPEDAILEAAKAPRPPGKTRSPFRRPPTVSTIYTRPSASQVDVFWDPPLPTEGTPPICTQTPLAWCSLGGGCHPSALPMGVSTSQIDRHHCPIGGVGFDRCLQLFQSRMSVAGMDVIASVR